MIIESEIFDNEPSAVAAPSVIGDFELLKTTAHANLWRARRDGKYLLVKSARHDTEHQQAMLQREYSLSIGCDHLHIVRTLSFERNLPIGEGIIMEYIDGRTLADYLAEKPSRTERRRIFEELLSAVGYMHKRGIIHNDLKPENILVTYSDNRLKIIDFGLADDDAHFALTHLGCTRGYASPELCRRADTIDARSDIYSVGIILGEMFGGGYGHIVRRCCREQATLRYAGIEALQRAWHRRNRRWWLAAIASLIAVLAVMLCLVRDDATNADVKHLSVMQIEHDLNDMFAAVGVELASMSYSEPAVQRVENLCEELAQYYAENISTISDTEAKALADEAYHNIMGSRLDALFNRAFLLPLTEVVEE